MTTIPDEIVEAAGFDAAFEAAWQAYCDAPRSRDMGRSALRLALSAALPMLVRAEREACAQLAEDKFQYATEASGVSEYLTGVAIATAIRARGER